MVQPDRKFSGGSGYRYGFNGKEKDLSITSDDYNYGARIYDARLGKMLSVDPLEDKYPSITPYNFVANSCLNAVDPTGKLIIFINGLWGWPIPIRGGGTVNYWGQQWVTDAQNAIGDHKQPSYYDGSMGGSLLKNPMIEDQYYREEAGKKAGYQDAKSILTNLDKDETIKFITNSMGAAFQRGFSKGLLKFRDERVAIIFSDLTIANIQRAELEKNIGQKRIQELNSGVFAPQTEQEKQYNKVKYNIGTLQAEKTKLENVVIEMVIDLSSHQTNYADPNAKSSYYMTAGKNMSTLEQIFINERSIKGAKKIGTMNGHHSSWANTTLFPSAAKRN